jgi:hypothetical protein
VAKAIERDPLGKKEGEGNKEPFPAFCFVQFAWETIGASINHNCTEHHAVCPFVFEQ